MTSVEEFKLKSIIALFDFLLSIYKKRLKKRYNALLIRYKKAGKFFDNPNITTAEKEKYLNKFIEILGDMNKIGFLLEAAGENIEDFYYDGFNI